MKKRNFTIVIFVVFIVLLVYIAFIMPFKFKREYEKQYNTAKTAISDRLKNWKAQGYNPDAPGAISAKWRNANFEKDALEKSLISNAIYTFLEQEAGAVNGETIPPHIWLQLKKDLTGHY